MGGTYKVRLYRVETITHAACVKVDASNRDEAVREAMGAEDVEWRQSSYYGGEPELVSTDRVE